MTAPSTAPRPFGPIKSRNPDATAHRNLPSTPPALHIISSDAHPPAGPGDCHCVPARRHGAGDALPPRAAKRHRLFSWRPHRAMVGAGLFHRRHGNLNTHDHRHPRHRLRRVFHLSSTLFLLPLCPPPPCLLAVPPPFFPRIFLRLTPDPKTPFPTHAPARPPPPPHLPPH